MRASESFPSFSDDDLDEDEMIRAGDRVSGSPVAAVGRGEMGSRARVVAPVDARAEARAEARGGGSLRGRLRIRTDGGRVRAAVAPTRET